MPTSTQCGRVLNPVPHSTANAAERRKRLSFFKDENKKESRSHKLKWSTEEPVTEHMKSGCENKSL